MSAQIAGQLIALLAAGAIIDRVDRKRYLIAMQFATASTWFVYSLLLGAELSNWLVLVGAVLGIVSGLNGPATQSVVRLLVDESVMRERIANLRITLNTIAIIGPAAGGAALGLFPAWTVTVGLGIANLASGYWLRRLPHLESPSRHGRDEGIGRRDYRQLLQPWFMIPVIFTAVMNVAWAGFFQVSGPILLMDAGSAPEASWGLISAALAVGLITGGIFFKRREFKDPLATPLLFVAPKALPVLVLALAPSAWTLVPAAFVAGFMLEAFAVNFYTQLQLLIPKGMLGLALSVDAFIGLSLIPLGYQLAAVAVETDAAFMWQYIAASVIVGVSLLGWIVIKATGRHRLVN